MADLIVVQVCVGLTDCVGWMDGTQSTTVPLLNGDDTMEKKNTVLTKKKDNEKKRGRFSVDPVEVVMSRIQ